MRPFRLLFLAFVATVASPRLRAAPVQFDLPAGPAVSALAAFVRQAGVEVLYASNDLKNITTNAVVGAFEPDVALERLFRATGFVSTRNGSGKFVIVRERKAVGVAEVRGLVVAQDGGMPVRDALVRVVGSPAMGRTRADGIFVVRELSAEKQSLVVQADGFVPLRISDLMLPAGQRTELGTLRLQAVTEGPQQLAEMVVNADDLGATRAPLLFSLQAMIVTPSRYGIDEERGNLAATLTESDLLALPQLGEDLYRAISHLPGLSADDLTARFWVRGAPHEQVLARLDGVDLIEPFHLKDTDSSLSILDLETISRLNLYTGGFSAEYGDRVAGVLTMETDSYARAKTRTTLGASLTGARAANRGQTPSGRSRWLVSARSGYPDIAIEASTNELDNGELRPRYYDLMGKWETNLTPDHVLSFHVLHAGDRMFFRDSDGPVLTSRYESDYAWARWRGSFGAVAGESVLSLAHVTWQRDGYGFLDRVAAVGLHDKRELRTVGWRQDWTLNLSDRALVRGGLDLKTGSADYAYSSLRDYYVLRNGVFQFERRTRNATAEPNGASAGLYLSTRFQPRPELTIELGLRHDRNDYAHDSETTPRFNVAWHAGQTTWRAAWGLYAQSQGLHNLAVADGDTTFRPAERAEHRVLSVERPIGAGLHLRLEAYERRVRRPRPHWDNVVDTGGALPELDGDRVRLDPVRQQARGAEIILERRGAEKLAWSASYAFARAEETLATGETVRRPRDQRHTVYVDVTYTPNPQWQFSFAWQYHTGWPTTELTFFSAPLAGGGTTVLNRLGPVYGLALPDYMRLDLRAQRRFQLSHGTLRAFIDVFNVLDRENTINYKYSVSSGPGGQVKVTRRTGDTLFPRLPSIGLTWDF